MVWKEMVKSVGAQGLIPSIKLIAVYFGHLPDYFPYWLCSVAANKQIDFLLVADMTPLFELPPNVRFVSMPLQNLRARVEAITGSEVAIPEGRGIKVCDLRPCFGEIFAEEIGESDFWGWVDIDVILGDLGRFVRRSRLARIDLLSTRERRTAGGLTIVRNVPILNTLFRSSRDLRKVITDKRSFGFDECGIYGERRVEGFTQCVRRGIREHGVRARFAELMRTDGKLEHRHRYLWNSGRLIDMDSGEDVMLYHFKDRKSDPNFSIHDYESSPGFLIDENAILPLRELPTIRGDFWLRFRNSTKYRVRLIRDQVLTRVGR